MSRRNDFSVSADKGIGLFVREVVDISNDRKPPILLVHGARVPGIPSFDLSVPGGSLAEEFAKIGHATYVMDVRGYGRSTRPPEMSESPESNRPIVRSSEAVQDIASVVEWIQSKRNGAKVAILGWATGGQWAGYYATLHPHKVSHLILYNALYAGSNRHPSIGHGSDLEDPDHPGKFNFSRYGAYSFNPGNGLLHSWNNSIPIEDKSLWRDPVIADAYVKASLESDSTSSTRTPPSFRAPLGALEDSFYLATGRQLWDASFIQSPTLILRSERDFWSRQEDVDTLLKHMVHASGTRASIIPNATHYVHLDRMERGRAQFILEVQSFISAQQTGNPDRS